MMDNSALKKVKPLSPAGPSMSHNWKSSCHPRVQEEAPSKAPAHEIQPRLSFHYSGSSPVVLQVEGGQYGGKKENGICQGILPQASP